MPNEKANEIDETLIAQISGKVKSLVSTIESNLSFIGYSLMIIAYTIILIRNLGFGLASLISIITIILVLYFIKRLSNIERNELKESRTILTQEQLKIQEKLAKQVSGFIEIPEKSLKYYLVAPYTPSSQVPKEEIIKMVEERFNSTFLPRIEEIEKRFPDESTIEKIASVNDAILATNIENLSDSVRRIEDKLLTKWDVVKIIFEILLVLGGIIGLILTIIKYNT